MALIWPNGSTTTPRVTSEFNPMRKHPVSGAMRPHRGIDLAGWRNIVSPVAGKVTTRAYQAGGAGNYVNITADNGDVFKFFHLASPSPLKLGQRVGPGTFVGVMGATGGVTGVHLHFEVWRHGKPVNPRTYYAAHGSASAEAVTIPPVIQTRNVGDPMILCWNEGKINAAFIAVNGGFASIPFDGPEHRDAKKAGLKEVWLSKANVTALINDARGIR